MNEKKTIKRFVDFGFGFPIVILNAPMLKVREVWTPNINQKVLQTKVVTYLCHYQGRLLGSHVKFLRLFLEMTVSSFADHLGLSHPAVLKWEKLGINPTGMNWSTEKDIRMLAFSKISKSSKDFLELYKSLEFKSLSREEVELVLRWG